MGRFDDQLLENFCLGFYGHGNLQGAYWFIGMEHGGGSSFENIKRRIDRWVQQNKEPVTDLVDYCSSIGEAHYFQKPVKNQPTWNKLIRLLLSLKGEEQTTLADVKSYQRSHWGRSDSETALLELLPLPNPSLNHLWLYGIHSSLPYLANRESYRTHLMPARVTRFQKMITAHKPKLVHFYGGSYAERWQQIASVDFTWKKAAGHTFAHGRGDDTLFLITKHPVARGITIKYFEQIEGVVRSIL